MTAETLAVIPARSGSKRVPQKNIRSVGGKPLIAHTIEQAEAVDQIDEAVVSTDSEEIAAVAEEHGGNVPFRRPEHLATGTSPIAAVLTHTLEHYAKRGREFDVLCLLQVTTPLRTEQDIATAIGNFLQNDQATSVVSVSAYATPPQWALRVDDDGRLKERYDPPVVFSDNHTRSQDLDTLVHPNGAIFVTDVESWFETESFYTEATVGYEMPVRRSIDIDEPWQLEVADALLSGERGTATEER